MVQYVVLRTHFHGAWLPLLPKRGHSLLHVPRIPQHNGIHDHSQGVELIFLAFPVGLMELSPFAVEDGPGQAMSRLAPIELR